MIDKRPLSPHITVHKWMLSQIVSILHRATAIGLTFGILFISLWLLSLSFGSIYYSIFKSIFFNFFGKAIIIIMSFCFFFHFVEELRRLFWAFGFGLEVKTIKLTSYFIIFLSLTFSLFILCCLKFRLVKSGKIHFKLILIRLMLLKKFDFKNTPAACA